MALHKHLLLIFLACLISSSYAYQFYVGGKDGWVPNPSENYNHWAERMRFSVNDTLLFKYKKGSNSVLVVNKDDYEKCNTNNPIKKMDDGNSIFKFDRSGPFFFISGNKNDCEKGSQKLIIVVLAIRTPPSAPTPPTPSTPPHGPVASPPATSPATPPAAISPIPAPVNQPPASSPGNAPTPATSPETSPVSQSPTSSPGNAPTPANSPATSPSTSHAPSINSPTSSPSPATSPAPARISPSGDITAPSPSSSGSSSSPTSSPPASGTPESPGKPTPGSIAPATGGGNSPPVDIQSPTGSSTNSKNSAIKAFTPSAVLMSLVLTIFLGGFVVFP